MSGWIKLHRSLKNWEWYSDHSATRLLVHLLVSVNYENKMWKGQEVEAGTLITSWENLALETGLTIKQVRTAMAKLEKSKEVARYATNKWQAITLVKWDKMQCLDTKEGQAEGQTKGRQRATTKEYKEIKEEKNIYRRFAHLSISKDELETLKINWTEEQINEILDQIENYAKNKQYKSLYLTAQNWLKKSYPIKKDEPFKFPWQ
jgi:hypothetical protein